MCLGRRGGSAASFGPAEVFVNASDVGRDPPCVRVVLKLASLLAQAQVHPRASWTALDPAEAWRRNFPGIYIVRWPHNHAPDFLSTPGLARHAEVRPPNALAESWRSILERQTTDVLYVGKAGALRERVRQLARFGVGLSDKHKGGEWLWQVQDIESAEIVLITCPPGCQVGFENSILERFKLLHGDYPLANRKPPQGPQRWWPGDSARIAGLEPTAGRSRRKRTLMTELGVTREDVAAWFLRLNGFLTTENFIVHQKETGGGAVPRTDADVIGVRFPQRAEVVDGCALSDHTSFQDCSRILFVIAEVKRGECELNGPLRNPEDRIIHDVLRACGFPESERDDAAMALYTTGHYEGDGSLEARAIAFGSRPSRAALRVHEQFCWTDVLGFIYERYVHFSDPKKQHQQWPAVGRALWTDPAEQREEYVARLLEEIMGLPGRP